MRNAGGGPCPCGSGRAYAECCGAGEKRNVVQLRGSNTRETAIAKLLAFAFQPEFDADHAAAEVVFWGDLIRSVPSHELQAVMDSEDATIKYNAWFLFDWDLGGEGTPLSLFLRDSRSLSPAERGFLRRVGEVPLRLYEVEAVNRGEGLRLRDLWSGARTWVTERTATAQIVTWDLLGARVASDGLGGRVFEGGLYLYPMEAKEEILAQFRRLHRRQARRREDPDRDPDLDASAFFRRHGMVFHHLWLNLVAFPEPPQVLTPEGEPLMFCRAVFDVADPDEVRARVAGRPDVQTLPDGTFAWGEPAAEGLRELGRWVFEGRRAQLETTSQGRALRGRAWLEGLAGPLVTHRATALETLEQAMADIRRSRPISGRALTGTDDVRDLFDRHYHAWLDRPDPDLGNRTPRAAARTRLWRIRLIDRLKQLENDAERAALGGRPPYDFTWIWEELKLDRS